MMRNVYLTILIGICLIGLVLAEESGGVLIGKQNDCIQLPQECASCSYAQLTKVVYPNMTIQIINSLMTKNGTAYNYTFCDTNDLGTYSYCTLADVDGTDTIACKPFDVTPGGSLISQGGSVILFGSLLVMIILSIIFLYIAVKSENVIAKVTLYSVSFIGFMMAILYTVVTIQQVLFGFDSIINGMETFWFVAKIGIGLGVIVLFVVIFLIMLKAWKIKRGFDD